MNGLIVHEAPTSKLKTMKEDVDLSTIINRNPYLLDDNTLSITENPKNIVCPNEDCEKRNKIKFIKYDFEDIKYIYICDNCNTKWNNI